MFDWLITAAVITLLIWLYEKLTGKSWWANTQLPAVGPVSPRYWRFPARVLACLSNGKITLIVWDEAKPEDGERTVTLPIGIIPFELRRPNTEFDILFDKQERRFIKALSKHEPHPDTI